MSSGSKPRIAWFSLLSDREGQNSISSYCTDIFLPYIAEEFEIDIFSNGDDRSYKGHHVFNYLSAFSRDEQNPYDFFFYQLEDSDQCDFVKLHLGLKPGIVFFHDILLREEMPPPLTFSIWPEVLNWVDSPEWPKRYPQPDRGPFAYRECSLSLLPIFSSERLANEFKRTVEKTLGDSFEPKDLRFFYLPLPVESFENSPLSKNETCIAFSGEVGIEHRAHKVLHAVRDLNDRFKLLWLVAPDEVSRAKELANEFSVHNLEIITERSAENWKKVLDRSSVAIHTHFSVYGTLGLNLSISLASKTPVIVTDFAEGEFLPESVVFKVSPGRNEATQIKSFIEEINNLSGSSELGLILDNAKSYVLEISDKKTVALELLQIFLSNLDFLRNARSTWSTLEQEARNFVLQKNLTSAWAAFFKPAFNEIGWADE
ncbi:MAG: glycosyltransferase [Deltaproteobacteria bacterium]|nr:glycosyltransferase [Deltaproteobacteria bacterium]